MSCEGRVDDPNYDYKKDHPLALMYDADEAWIVDSVCLWAHDFEDPICTYEGGDMPKIPLVAAARIILRGDNAMLHDSRGRRSMRSKLLCAVL